MTRAPDDRGTLGPEWIADNLPQQDFDRGMLARRSDDQHATWIDDARPRMCWPCRLFWQAVVVFVAVLLLAIAVLLFAVGLWAVWHALGLLIAVGADALHIYSLPKG